MKAIRAAMVEIGHFALVLALRAGTGPIGGATVGARTGNDRLMAVWRPGPVSGFALTALSFAGARRSPICSPISRWPMSGRIHSLQPLIYKLTGTWGNHEGSMLLWVLILSFFGALVAASGANLACLLAGQCPGCAGLDRRGFPPFILTTLEPLRSLDPGSYRRPASIRFLQDIGLAVHPPLLYLGYVGLDLLLLCIAALLEGRIDAAWARWVRPWTLLPGSS